MTDFLIGRPTLTVLGIDPQGALDSKIRDGFQFFDFDSLDEVGEIATRLADLVLDIVDHDDDFYDDGMADDGDMNVRMAVSRDNDDDDDDGVHDEKDDIPFVPDVDQAEADEILRYLRKRVLGAKEDAKLSPKGLDALKAMVKRYEQYIFRSQSGSSKPLKCEPARTTLKPGAVPVRCKPRYYAPDQKEFMEKLIQMLVDRDMVYVNMNSRWASPVIIVKRPNGGFRMVVTRGRSSCECAM